MILLFNMKLLKSRYEFEFNQTSMQVSDIDWKIKKKKLKLDYQIDLLKYF